MSQFSKSSGLVEITEFPSSVSAERFVLSILLMGDPLFWDQVMDSLRASDFYRPSHQSIFSVMEDMYQQGRCGDTMSVSDELKKRNQLKNVGGDSYLAELAKEVISPVGLDNCTQIIKEKSVLRKVIQFCTRFREKALTQNIGQLNSFVDLLEKELFQFTETISQQTLVSVASLMKGHLERLEELSLKKLSITGVSTAFSELDHFTSGFQPGELSIIAARPSMGKTAISLNMALSAVLNKKKVAFFSVEMAREQIIQRLLSLSARIPLTNLRNGNIDTAEWDRLVQAGSKLTDTHFFIDDSSMISPFEIRSRVRRLKSKHGLDIVFIDYLQLMSLQGTTESREREVSEMSRLLKSMAKELKLPVVALSQLNRGVEGRRNRRPLLSDLRESGSLEQDADVIMMLYRPDYYDEHSEEDKNQVELILNKQRNGPTGIVKLKWNASYGLFESDPKISSDAPSPILPAIPTSSAPPPVMAPSFPSPPPSPSPDSPYPM